MYCFQCVMKWFSNGNFKLVWYHLSYSQLTMGALMMLILAVCKVVVTFEPSITSAYHLVICSLVVEHRSSKSAGQGFDSSNSFWAHDKTKTKFVIFHQVSFCFFYSFTSQLPSCQRDEGWNGVEGWRASQTGTSLLKESFVPTDGKEQFLRYSSKSSSW